jgi:hypothetical protein
MPAPKDPNQPTEVEKMVDQLMEMINQVVTKPDPEPKFSNNEEMVLNIHATTLSFIESGTGTVEDLPFPQYYAFDTDGNLAILACEISEVSEQHHQHMLRDAKKQLKQQGFKFLAFAVQNTVKAIPRRPGDNTPATDKEIQNSKVQIMTQFCTHKGEEIAFVSTTDNSDYGFVSKDNPSLQKSPFTHILWTTATDNAHISIASLMCANTSH